MTKISITRIINAPLEEIFKAVSDVQAMPDVVPDVTKTEFISEIKTGVGTQFRETRKMGRKDSITELEITEYVKNEHVRMVADSHGTVWDSVFTVKVVPGRSELTLMMDAKGSWFLPRLMNFLMQRLYKKGLEKHMTAVKTYCEKKN